MLIRFLSIATMSVTLLTIQAMNSSETKSSLPSQTIQSQEESIFSENSEFTILQNKNQEKIADIPPVRKSFERKQPTVILATIGEITLKLPEVKFTVRPSYLPPIDFLSNDDDLNDQEQPPLLTASINQGNEVISIIEPKKQATKKIRAPKYKRVSKYKKPRNKFKKKYKSSKKYKKKYAQLKKNKYKKYKLGKRVKRHKQKRRSARHYKPANYMASFN